MALLEFFYIKFIPTQTKLFNVKIYKSSRFVSLPQQT